MSLAMERSAVPPGGPPLKRKIAAILAADVVGYSRLVAADEEGTLRGFAAAREIFDGLVHRAGGRIFNTAGDSVMCEFDSAVEAVRVAVDIQKSLAAASAGIDPARRIEFRIGITIGDVVERGNDLLGDGVNIAARLEAMAPAGGICVSRSVHEAVANKIPVEFQDVGARKVKNLPQPIHAFVVARPAEPVPRSDPFVLAARRDRSETAERTSGGRRALWPLAALGIVLAAGVAAVPGLPALKRAFETSTSSNTASQAKPPFNLAGATPVEIVTPDKPAQQQPTKPPVRPPVRNVEKTPDKPAAADKPVSPADQPTVVATTKALSPAEAAAAFLALSRTGIVADAKTLPELYHNARLQEANGDRSAALRSYTAAAPMAGNAVDVLIRYTSLARTISGSDAARKIVQDLARPTATSSVALLAAIQGDGADRRAKLEALATENPDFLPAAYFLAEALMEKRQGGPTLMDRRLAFAALDRFIEGAETGAITSLFVDGSFLDGWLDAARTRRGEIEAYFASASVRPSGSFVRTESGWTARIALPESATQVSARIGETGETAQASSATGRPTSAADIPLPASLGRSTLYVTYRDLSGREAGPFPLAFDPGTTLVNAARESLERSPESWVSFRQDVPDVLSYAQLLANRCALREALIGFGDDPPNQKLPLPACSPTSSGAAPDVRPVIALPDGTDTVQVRLAYADGTESPVRTFRRP